MKRYVASSSRSSNPAASIALGLALSFWVTQGCGSDAESGSGLQGVSGSNTVPGGANGGAHQAGAGGHAGALGGSGSNGGTADAGNGSGGSAGSGSTGSGGSSGAGGNERGGAGGSAGKGGNAGAGNTGAAGSGGGPVKGNAGGTFAKNRFHFGTIDSIAKNAGSAMISQLDFFTGGWLQADTFDHKGICDETKAGAPLENLVPVQVAYVSAAHVKRQDRTVCDCNVTSSPCVAQNDLCHVGAQRITQEFPAILNAYKSYSQGFAACYGTTKPLVFELEPDWYQYTGSTQTQPWMPAQAAQMLAQIVNALKSALPNARFSIDVSPWVAPDNGTDNGKQWYSNFDMSLFTFVNTSGGGTNANAAKIRTGNSMTWAGLSQVTGKPILADTGYGANGASAGEDALWNQATNINARIADGVVSISQYNAKSDWGSRISSVRGQLSPVVFGP